MRELTAVARSGPQSDRGHPVSLGGSTPPCPCDATGTRWTSDPLLLIRDGLTLAAER